MPTGIFTKRDRIMNYELLKVYRNSAENFNRYNGIVVTEIRDGYCEAEVEMTKWSLNPMGVAHGGLIFTLCDVVTCVAAATSGKMMLTLNSSISFLRPGKGKKIHAVGECIKEGRTTGLFEAKVYDEENRLISKGDFTLYYTGEKIPLPEGD